MPSSFVLQLARRLQAPPDQVEEMVGAWATALRSQVEAQGSATVPGLGTFRANRGSIVFEPSEALALAVNQRFAGLEPVIIEPAPEPAFKKMEVVRAEPPVVEPETEDTPVAPAAILSEPLLDAVDEQAVTSAAELMPLNEPEAEPEINAWETSPAFIVDEFGPPPSVPDPQSEELEFDPVKEGNSVETEPPVATVSGAALHLDDEADRLRREWQDRNALRRPVEEQPRRSVPMMFGVLLLMVALGALAYTFLTDFASNPRAADSQRPPAVVDSSTMAAAIPPETTSTSTILSETPAEAQPEPAQTQAPVPAEPQPEAPTGPLVSSLSGDAPIDASRGGYTLVAESSVDRELAEQAVKKYQKQGLRASLIHNTFNNKTRYRIVVGQFKSSNEAVAAAREASSSLPSSAWVMPLK